MIALPPGSIFHGRYEVVRCIKAGGMGAVYEVVHLETRRRRALKLMLPAVLESVDMRARFALEATVAADIESEHIVETLDAGVDDETGAPFLVMELLRGSDLAALLARRRGLSPADVVRLLSQAASALDKTHAAGVVHRDLKPENLFLTRRDDGSPKLKILDFGIAKIVSESGQGAAKTKVLGTPLYMSPEQVRGDGRIGPRADLYALAQIAFTLLAGKAYWAEEHEALPTYALMTKIIGGCPEPASARAARYGGATLVTMGGTPIPPAAFDAWFARATRVVPEERFPSAAAMVEALAEALWVEAPRTRADEIATSPRLAGPADPEGDTTVPLSGGRPAVPDDPDGTVDLEQDAAPEAAPPTSSCGTRTEEPASLAPAERSRKHPDLRRIAGVAAATALVACAVAITVRSLGAWSPAVDVAASATSAAAERPTPSPPAPSARVPVTPPAPEPAAGPASVASSASSPPASAAVASERRVPARRAVHGGGDPHTPATGAPSAARPAAEPPAVVAEPRTSGAPPAARPPAPAGDAHPARSLD